MEGFEHNENKEADMKLVDFPFICRICLKRSDLRLCKVEDCLLDLFLTVTKIDVHSTYNCPMNICIVCLNTLKFISLFIDMSKYNEKKRGKNSKLKNEHEQLKPVECGMSANHVIKIEETTEEYIEEVQYVKGFEICRICSSTSDLTPFEERTHLMELFQKIANIDIKNDANSSGRNNICNKCINKLENISLFINLSLSNDTKLENTIGRNETVGENCSEENVIHSSFSECYDIKFENISDENQGKMEDDLDENACLYDSNLQTCIDIKEEIADSPEAPIEQTYRNRLRIFEKPFKCDCCEKSFTLKASLKHHMLTHTGERPFKCECCEKSFARKATLQQHMLTHTGDKPFKCHCCEKSFKQTSHLRWHFLIHTKEKPIKLEKISNHKINFQRPCETGERPFLCDSCGKSYPKKHSLLHHMLTHTGDKPFKCDSCEKSFSLKGSLKRHFLTHTEENSNQNGNSQTHLYLVTRARFQCDSCEKSFTQKHSLQSHMLSHTGVKLFKCDFCEKRFSHRCNLRRHLRTHTGERPFKCDSCESSFRERTDLQRHKLTHTGEKPFKCDRCEKKFNHKGNLRKHFLLTHTEENPLELE